MEKIRNIVVSHCKFIQENLVDYSYALDRNDYSRECERKVNFRLPVSLEGRLKDEKSFSIVESGNTEFVNGFKIVKNEYGQSLYIREEDNKLLPYVFDIATDFNEFGLAMVATDTKVSWINKSFKYINIYGELCDYDNMMEDGWKGVYDFSDSQKPLSRLKNNSTYHSGVSYMNKDMEFESFHEFDGEEINKNSGMDSFDSESGDFDKDGFAYAGDFVLCDQGFYVYSDVVVKEAMNKGLVKDICAKVYKKN